MKNTVTQITLAISCLLLSLTSSAQDAVFDNGLSLKFSYISANTDFGEMTDYYNRAEDEGELYGSTNNPFNADVPTTSQDRSNFGLGLRIGNMFFFNSLNFSEHVRLGLDVTYFGINYVSVAHNIDQIGNNDRFTINHLFFNPEIGPMLSYSPVSNLAFDAGFKVSPTLAFKFGGYETTYFDRQYDESFFGYGLGLRYGPAFYMRYHPFLMGFQYNMGNVNFKTSSSDRSLSYEDQNPYGAFNFLIGFKF
jgi:hypothetical protein